ncbi:hypothetical protein WN71_031910 [Streptomyces mangrovisoli]|uniref:DUF11 domain-containing protein n=2 Tax=Streptomyces mangrovisoli TaxID=1428628 RepID=A0A1J4NPG5_9ACTN|nr:hypothetical protein WN71_031910 [Streptomyces mangrovisoli]
MADAPALVVAATGPDAEGAHPIVVEVAKGSEHIVRLRESVASDCTGSATRLVCLLDRGPQPQTRVPLAAVKGGRIGDTGRIRFTYKRSDGNQLTTRTDVVVGEPVLEVLKTPARKDLRPGSAFTAPVAVRNTGEVPVLGLGLQLSAHGVDFAERYANCRYPTPPARAAVCRFAGLRIAPGQTVVVLPAMRLRASKTGMYGDYTVQAWPLDVGTTQENVYANAPASGDGPTLTAGVEDGVRGTFTQGVVGTDLSIDTTADYQVTGADLHGAPGSRRTLRLTVRNNGPGDPGYSSELVFTPPPGSGVVKEPMRETDVDSYEPFCDSTDGTYRCPMDRLAPGDSRTFTFTLRLGEPAEGTVRVEDIRSPDTEGTDPPGRTGRRDPDPGNDRATVRVLR